MTRALHHLAVVVSDLEAAERFYAGVLGLPVLKRFGDEQGRPRSVWVGLRGGIFLALERSASPGPIRSAEAPGWHCIALEIAPEEREGLRRSLEARGITVERESDYTLYLKDPDGNLLGLSHYPIRAPGPPAPARPA